MNAQHGPEIVAELRKIAKLLVLTLTKDEPKQVANIELLSKVGFAPREIAELLGTTPNTVNVALSQMRSKGKLSARGRSRGKNEGGNDE